MRSTRLSLLVFAVFCALIALPAVAPAAVHVKSLSTFGEFGKATIQFYYGADGGYD